MKLYKKGYPDNQIINKDGLFYFIFLQAYEVKICYKT